MNLKSTYIHRLWIITLILSVPSLHANIFDLFNLKGIECVEGDQQYVISYHVLKQMRKAYLPIRLECGEKRKEKLPFQSTTMADIKLVLRVDEWDEMRNLLTFPTFDITKIYSTIRSYFHGESIAKVEQRVNDYINGRNVSIAQMLLIKLLYATKIRDIPASFALISKHNPQVSEGELWHIFETFSAVMQRSLALNYDLVVGE